MAASEVASFKLNFFEIASTSEDGNLMNGKAECLLAIGDDKKDKERPSP